MRESMKAGLLAGAVMLGFTSCTMAQDGTKGVANYELFGFDEDQVIAAIQSGETVPIDKVGVLLNYRFEDQEYILGEIGRDTERNLITYALIGENGINMGSDPDKMCVPFQLSKSTAKAGSLTKDEYASLPAWGCQFNVTYNPAVPPDSRGAVWVDFYQPGMAGSGAGLIIQIVYRCWRTDHVSELADIFTTPQIVNLCTREDADMPS